MAKLINPLGSISAHGRFGGVIFQTGPWGQIVKGHVPQRYRPTEEQYYRNFLFGRCADEWRVLSDQEKEEWNIKARGKKMTGFNLYMKENILRSKTGIYNFNKYGKKCYA